MAIDIKKQQHWQRHTERWQASGLTRRAYCAREGLAVSTFDHWRRQARDAQHNETAQTPAAPLTLIPARLDSSNEIHLHSPGGWRVAFPATLDPDTLAHLLASLP